MNTKIYVPDRQTHWRSTTFSQNACIQSRSSLSAGLLESFMPMTSCHMESLSMNDSNRSCADGTTTFARSFCCFFFVEGTTSFAGIFTRGSGEQGPGRESLRR